MSSLWPRLQKLPIKAKRWQINPSVKHDMASAYFANAFAKARAKKLGLPWRVSVQLGHTAIPGRWYGHAYGKRGRGRIRCWVNGTLPIIESIDRRYKNQPAYVLWGADETICFLFGHEFGHIIGYGGDKAGEMACNKFGFECVQAWRARQYDAPACLI